jgi:energy-coupling factor transporter ATP-binding protein EcfA2
VTQELPTTPALSIPEVSAWLAGLAADLDRGLTGDHRTRVALQLRTIAGGAPAPLRALVTLALIDDCLRVAHLAIEADDRSDSSELERARPLAAVAARKYFQILPTYEQFGEADLTDEELTAFLEAHRADRGPFGGAGPEAWHGLGLCREVARLASHPAILRDHERMLARVMDAVFDGRASAVENAARRRLRDLFEPAIEAGDDPRAVAFCRGDGPEVFSTVAHGSQIHDRDPLDVETIHAEARETFNRQIEHAITPIRHGTGHGRTMLVLGSSGSGKTHLLRAFRAHVHGERLGYVGYLQMTAEAGDYARYVLQNLIASLERPYDAPALRESALMYLSDGLAEHDGAIPRADLERLRDAELDPAAMTSLVGGMVDRLMRAEGMASVDSDLVQALLLLQRRDPAIQRRVVKFLRCDALTPHESALLGGLTGRSAPEDATRTIEQLGALAYHLQQAALVLLVDQIEDVVPEGGIPRVQRAIDVLRKIADAVPSAVVVIACLDDVYDHVRARLTQSVIDRLEREPAPVRLASQRARDEIEQLLATRLEHLYDTLDVGWRPDEPLFPFTADDVDRVVNQRARDCLAHFHNIHQECIRAGAIVDRAPAAPAVKERPAGKHAELDTLWADAQAAPVVTPEDDAQLLVLLARGVDGCRLEIGGAFTCTHEDGERPRLSIGGIETGKPRVVEICNRTAQGGHLGQQLDDLRTGVPAGAVPVAFRVGEFSFGAKTATARKVGQLVAAGGIALAVSDGELRALAVMEKFATTHGGRADFTAWRKSRQPLAQLALFRTLLLGGSSAVTGPRTMPGAEPVPTTRHPTLPGAPGIAVARGPGAELAAKPKTIRLGVTSTMRGEPMHVDVEQLKKHAAFLGASGSGKTTIALHVIEQLLERDVSAILVDRKGDLARYADPAWWDEQPADDEQRARKAAIRDRVDISLYTPGDSSGRALGLPVIPAGMARMTSQERDQIAKVAASGLAAMMGYGKGEKFKKREAILKVAIELHAGAGPDEDGPGGATIDDLKATIERPDPEVLAVVGNLGRHFGGLAEDLSTLWINNRSLLGSTDEVLDVPAMLDRREGRPRLVVISTAALTDTAVVQFWVSRLLVELGRHVRANPSDKLQAVAFFDEADIYVPAVGVPATKEPMFDLLRRARSGGLGMFLASQNPGDFDYNARNNIETWLVGKVTEARAIEKMRNLIGQYPNVGSRLAGQATGSFFVLSSKPVREIRTDQALMTTQQVSAQEIARLAAATRR